METVRIIFATIVMFALPLFIYIPFISNKIRSLDTLIFKWLEKKNKKLGFLFHFSKIIFLLVSTFLFLRVSRDFYKDIWALQNEAFYLALISVGVIHLSFVYNISRYLFIIYSRGFVYIDEVIKILALGFVTTLLNIIASELAFFL